jgi:hypothetical protein
MSLLVEPGHPGAWRSAKAVKLIAKNKSESAMKKTSCSGPLQAPT